MLSIDDISLRLGDFFLSNISIDVEKGEYIVILGMSGVGKTVLLEILSGILHSEQGRLILDDKDITREKIQRRPFGLVYQDQALFPHLSVRRNVEYGLRCQKKPASEIKKRVNHIAAELGIQHLLQRHPSSLSGGEAQRVALGRVLVTDPRILLLDEPLSALDTQARSNMRRLLKNIHRRGQTIIHVTHDYEEAISLASRIVLMENGTIIQTGSPDEIFRHPKSQFVARFVGIRNFFQGQLISAGEDGQRTATFTTDGIAFSISSKCESGPGFCMLRSEDVTLSSKPDRTDGLNKLPGTITDIIPSSLGVEVIVDIGFEVSAMVTRKTIRRLDLDIGNQVFVGFKENAARFISMAADGTISAGAPIPVFFSAGNRRQFTRTA